MTRTAQAAAALAAGVLVAGVGLAVMALLPVTPPDDPFAARIRAIQVSPPTPRPPPR